MHDLDELLELLARAPIPSAVAQLDSASILVIAASRRNARRASMMAGLGALLLGVGSTAVPAYSSAAQLLPLGAATPLAPSSLLVR